MRSVVIDASIAIKWVVDEKVGECANILWKKVRRRELSHREPFLLQGAELELLPTLSLLETATLIAIELAHPAYDCVYIATAAANNCPFVTADERLVRKVSQHRQEKYSVVLLADALSIP